MSILTTKCYAQARGSVIRVTKLDSCGNPDPGQSAVVVSKRVSTVTIAEVNDTGTNVRERNFADELCIVDDSHDTVIGYTAEVQMCGVDPDLIAMMTGNPVVKDALGNVVGFDAVTGIDIDQTAIAIEVWSRIAGSACDPSGHRQWGYTVFPFLKGGRLGGFTFQNGAVQFVQQNAQSRDGNNWGVGPFDVTRNAVGAPAPLATALSPNAHYRNILVNLDPPAPSCGAFPLAAGSF